MTTYEGQSIFEFYSPCPAFSSLSFSFFLKIKENKFSLTKVKKNFQIFQLGGMQQLTLEWLHVSFLTL